MASEPSTKRWTVWFCDTFDGTRWNETYASEDEAKSAALASAGEMLTAHVDDPSGKLVARFGRY